MLPFYNGEVNDLWFPLAYNGGTSETTGRGIRFAAVWHILSSTPIPHPTTVIDDYEVREALSIMRQRVENLADEKQVQPLRAADEESVTSTPEPGSEAKPKKKHRRTHGLEDRADWDTVCHLLPILEYLLVFVWTCPSIPFCDEEALFSPLFSYPSAPASQRHFVGTFVMSIL